MPHNPRPSPSSGDTPPLAPKRVEIQGLLPIAITLAISISLLHFVHKMHLRWVGSSVTPCAARSTSWGLVGGP